MGFCRYASVALVAAAALLPIHAVAASGSGEKDPYNNLPQLDTRYQPLETLARGLFYLETMYVDEDEGEARRHGQNALKGVIDKLDPHTVLMPKKAFEQLTIDTQGKFGGVGIIVSRRTTSKLDRRLADRRHAGLHRGRESRRRDHRHRRRQ